MTTHDDLQTFTHRSIRRGNSVVLHAGTLRLPVSGVVGLVGINGAGKSTLMLGIADLLRRPLWCAPFIAMPTSHDNQRVAYSPQRPTFPPWLTALEVVRMFGIDYDELQASQPALLLEELRCIRADRLSTGQSQALSVACALQLDARITLLDEPFAPLDFRRRIALSQLLQHRRSSVCRDRLTIVSTQSAAELVDVCDWLVVLKAGRYALSAPMREVMQGARGDEDARAIVEERVLEALL